MKNRKLTWLAFIIIIVFSGAWLGLQPSSLPSRQINSNMVGNITNTIVFVPTNTIDAIATNSTPSTVVVEAIHSNAAVINDEYKQGKISKGEAIQATLMEENKLPLDFYGRVIDQYGQPVVGAKIQGNVFLNVNFVRSGNEVHYTETDASGNFSFVGLHGVRIGVVPSKEGYEMGLRGEGYKGPVGEKTSPNDRAILTMWKLKGAEPMIHDQKFYGINPDGRAYTIDLVNRKKIEGGNAEGDLRVHIQRPAQIQTGQKFDWLFDMNVIKGGVIEVTDNSFYLNEAPENGYQPQYEIKMSSADSDWQEQAQKTFYLKSRNGQVYGRFIITAIPNYNDTSVFKIDSYINPAGSRNLEFDSSKQIR